MKFTHLKFLNLFILFLAIVTPIYAYDNSTLLYYFTMGDGTGTTFFDSHRSNLGKGVVCDGSCWNPTLLLETDAIQGNALTYTYPGNRYYVASMGLDNVSVVDFNLTNWSMNFWIKFNGTYSTSQTNSHFGMGSNGLGTSWQDSSYRLFEFYHLGNITNLYFTKYSGSWSNTYTYNLNYSDNSWHMVTLTFNTSDSKTYVYSDGSYLGSQVWVQHLGAVYVRFPALNNNSIDEISLWNSTLNLSDISYLYNNGSGRNYLQTYGSNGDVQIEDVQVFFCLNDTTYCYVGYYYDGDYYCYPGYELNCTGYCDWDTNSCVDSYYFNSSGWNVSQWVDYYSDYVNSSGYELVGYFNNMCIIGTDYRCQLGFVYNDSGTWYYMCHEDLLDVCPLGCNTHIYDLDTAQHWYNPGKKTCADTMTQANYVDLFVYCLSAEQESYWNDNSSVQNFFNFFRLMDMSFLSCISYLGVGSPSPNTVKYLINGTCTDVTPQEIYLGNTSHDYYYYGACVYEDNSANCTNVCTKTSNYCVNEYQFETCYQEATGCYSLLTVSCRDGYICDFYTNSCILNNTWVNPNATGNVSAGLGNVSIDFSDEIPEQRYGLVIALLLGVLIFWWWFGYTYAITSEVLGVFVIVSVALILGVAFVTKMLEWWIGLILGLLSLLLVITIRGANQLKTGGQTYEKEYRYPDGKSLVVKRK